MTVVDPSAGSLPFVLPEGVTLFPPLPTLAQAGGEGAGGGGTPTTGDPGAAGGEGGTQPQPMDLSSMIFMFVIIYVVFYLLIIRPQRKQQQDHRKLLAELKKNDAVRTSGGIFGKVSRVEDDKVTLVVDEKQNVKIQVSRASIVAVIDRDGVVHEPAPAAGAGK